MVLEAMSRFRVGLAGLALCTVLAAPAGAQSAGNGLYEPFPEAAPRERAESYVFELGRAPVSDETYERGSFVGDELRPAPAGAPSSRAGGADAPSTAALWAVALAMLAACAAPSLRQAARQRRA